LAGLQLYAKTHSGGTRTPAAARAKLLSAKTDALALGHGMLNDGNIFMSYIFFIGV